MIVLTGGSGILGTAIQEEATKLGLDLLAPGHRVLDVTDFSECERLLGSLERSDVVIHCAAKTNLDECHQRSLDCFNVNAIGTWNVAGMVEKRGAYLVHVSTDYVYDGSPRELEHSETDIPSNPCTAYGISKLAAENFARMSGCRLLIVRLGWLFGSDPFKDPKFVGQRIRDSLSKEFVEVVDDKVGTFTYAPHVARKILEFVGIKQQGIRNLTNRGLVSRLVFIERLFKLWEIRTPLKGVPSSHFKNLVGRPDFSGLRTIYPDAEMPSWQQALLQYQKAYPNIELPRQVERQLAPAL